MRNKKPLITSGLAVSALLTLGTSASAVVLVNFADNTGNGMLLNGTGGFSTGVLINEALPGNFSTNTNGRALASYGNDGENGVTGSASAISDITNNAGVDIDGWTVYRGEYTGGNNGFGFLENGMRLGESGNIAGNGHAFANAGEFFLFSDVFNLPVAATDEVTISFRGGSDEAPPTNFDAFLIFDGANAAVQVGSNQAGNSTGSPRLEFTGTGFTGASTVQLVIEAATDGANTRSLIDDVYFEISPVPEPSASILALAGGIGLIFRRRR